MQYKDLLRATVLLVAVEATALAAIAALSINSDRDELLATLTLGWWAAAIVAGIGMGGTAAAAEAVRPALASARTSTSLPAESPLRIGLGRLWPIGLFAVVAGGLGPLFPQVPAIAAGFALLVALAWRRREAAVTAIEDRDGVCFYVEHGSAFEQVKLIRTPGLRRGYVEAAHPPPPSR